MNALFGFEVTVGVFALYLETYGFKPRAVAVETVVFGKFVSVFFGVAYIHAVEHFRPVASLGSARARVQSKYRVARIVLTFKQSAKSYILYFLFRLGKVFVNLGKNAFVALFFGEFDHHPRVGDGFFGFIENVEFVSDLLRLAT